MCMLDSELYNPLLSVVNGRFMTMASAAKKPATKLLTIGVRFSPVEKAALEKYAGAEDRPVSVMLRKIVVDCLREKGHLK